MKNLTFDLRPVGPSPIAVEAVTHRLYAAGDRSLIICVLSDAGTESETHIYIHTHTHAILRKVTRDCLYMLQRTHHHLSVRGVIVRRQHLR